VRHEYTNEEIMVHGHVPAAPTREQVETAWAAQVVRADRRSGRLWPVVGDVLNRRVTDTTPMRITGPAAGSDLLGTHSDPADRTVLGTLNNRGGITPWGTVLTGEENFNQYFANAAAVTGPVAKARLTRYGLPTGASGRRWEHFADRFDIAKEPNEPNRFGWVVEIDPYDPTSTPRKRTALGRFEHEAAEPRLTRDGRVALYMGDDARFDYLYKYVSEETYRKGDSRAAREHNMELLDEGTLYVAKFTGDSPAEDVGGTAHSRIPSSSTPATGTMMSALSTSPSSSRASTMCAGLPSPSRRGCIGATPSRQPAGGRVRGNPGRAPAAARRQHLGTTAHHTRPTALPPLTPPRNARHPP
jgi:secreted PhoX family phosphatase